MTDLIGRLVTWLSILLTGRERRPSDPARPAPTRVPAGVAALLPAHRSPYSQDVTLLDGTAAKSVRPYLTAHEQRQRRRELAMATLGLDMPGPYWIHGTEVA
nr:hypothetical protein OG999_30475 [Streptomyces sp. NBC_00886]